MRRKIVVIGVTLLAIGIVAIIFSLVQIPFQEQEPYDVPKSSVLLEESIVVPARGILGGGGEISRTLVLNAGDEINIYFRVTSGGDLDVDFHFRDGVNTVFSLPRVSSHNSTITIANNSTYYTVWDNSFSWLTDKQVTTKITKLWNEIAYRDITTYHTIFPSEYTTITEYAGIVLILAGIASIGWGVASQSASLIEEKEIKGTADQL